MADCEMLPKCGFFHKYRGARQAECRRREHRARFGVAPSDDMLPSGQMVPEHMRPGAR